MNRSITILAQCEGEEYVFNAFERLLCEKSQPTAKQGKENYGPVHDTIFEFVSQLKQFLALDKKVDRKSELIIE